MGERGNDPIFRPAPRLNMVQCPTPAGINIADIHAYRPQNHRIHILSPPPASQKGFPVEIIGEDFLSGIS
jgi:hypothetical protein